MSSNAGEGRDNMAVYKVKADRVDEEIIASGFSAAYLRLARRLCGRESRKLLSVAGVVPKSSVYLALENGEGARVSIDVASNKAGSRQLLFELVEDDGEEVVSTISSY